MKTIRENLPLILFDVVIALALLFAVAGCTTTGGAPTTLPAPTTQQVADTYQRAQQVILDLHDLGIISDKQISQVAKDQKKVQAVLSLYDLFVGGASTNILNAPLQSQDQLDVRWAAIK